MDVVHFINRIKKDANFQLYILRELATDCGSNFNGDNPDEIVIYPDDNHEYKDLSVAELIALKYCFLCNKELTKVDIKYGQRFCKKCRKEFPVVNKKHQNCIAKETINYEKRNKCLKPQ